MFFFFCCYSILFLWITVSQFLPFILDALFLVCLWLLCEDLEQSWRGREDSKVSSLWHEKPAPVYLKATRLRKLLLISSSLSSFRKTWNAKASPHALSAPVNFSLSPYCELINFLNLNHLCISGRDKPYLIMIYLSQHFITNIFKYIKNLNFPLNIYIPAIEINI